MLRARRRPRPRGARAGGCAASRRRRAGPHGGKVQVVAAFYPLAVRRQRVAGDRRRRSTNLTHARRRAARPRAHRRARPPRSSDADLVLYEKGFQPAVDDAVEQNATDDDARASADVGRPRHRGRRPDESSTRTSGRTRRGWPTSPTRSATSSRRSTRPTRRTTGRRRRRPARPTSSGSTAPTQPGCATCRVTTIVVSHDAFGYLVEVRPAGAAASPASPPTPSRRPGTSGELQDLIRSDGITTVFSETLASPKLAESLARDLGIAHRGARPDRGRLSDETAGTDYLSLMRGTWRALREGERLLMTRPAVLDASPTAPSRSAAGRSCATST